MEKIQHILKNESLGTYVGKITKIVGLRIESNGPLSKIGDICEIESLDKTQTVLAEVVGVEGLNVYLLPYTDLEGIGFGSKVINLNHVLEIPVGKNMLGRIVDPLGRPIDGRGEIETREVYSVKGTRINPFERPRIQEILSLGVRSIDSLLTMGKGQRCGIFAGSGVGKSTLMGMIARNVKADINVIALVGERGREVNEFIEKDLGPEGLARSIVVVATSDESAMMRSKCALSATTIAEYFRDQGLDVLLMMDSLTRFAMAEREIGLSVGESPIARGYTPSIYTALPKLLERAGNTQKGSITGLYTVLVEGDDSNEPISDTVRGIIDGHIMLSRKIAMKNHYPAIDILASISRLMSDIATDQHKKMASKIRQLMAIYQENEDLLSIGAYKSGSNPSLDESIKKIQSINRFLVQEVSEVSSFDESIKSMENVLKS
jgi:flagellum-specific ATP synthase